MGLLCSHETLQSIKSFIRSPTWQAELPLSFATLHDFDGAQIP